MGFQTPSDGVIAMAEDRKRIEGTETILSCLKTNRDKRIDDLAILSVMDLFVIRSPRVRENAKRSSAQTAYLSKKGWTPEMVKRAIAKTLFDDGVAFCKRPSSFAAEARKKGLYLDERLEKAKTQAFLVQEGYWVEKRDGTQRFMEQEEEADCFFRHLRNGIAHGSIYRLPQGRCAFIDRSDGSKGRLTGYIVTTIGRLDKLRSILLNKPGRRFR